MKYRFSKRKEALCGPKASLSPMVNLIFAEDGEVLSQPGIVRTMYDPTAGTRIQARQNRRTATFLNTCRLNGEANSTEIKCV
jgi:hypothetical protein